MRNDSENRFVGQNIFFDLFIIIVLFTIFFWSLNRFLNDINPSPLSTADPFGLTIESKNDVRTKNPSNLVWHPLGVSRPIANGDYVFTGNNSKAKIKIKNGNISIGANTLIQLKQKENSLDIDFKKGSLKIENQAEPTIKIQTSKFKNKLEIKNASVLILDDKENLKVQVSSGSVDIGNGIVISQHDQVTLNENSDPIIESFDTSFAKPLNGSVVYHTDHKIKFELHQPLAERTWIWISSDPDFKNKISRRWDPNVPDKFVSIPNDGLYYYQLFDVNGNAKSFQSRFTMQFFKKPELFSPKDNSLSYDSKMNLLWIKSKNENVLSRLQISKDSNFKEIVLDHLLNSESDVFESTIGTYYWRVRFENSVLYSDWSEKRSFDFVNYKISKLAISISREKLPLINGEAVLRVQAKSVQSGSILKFNLFKDSNIYKTWDSLKDSTEIRILERGSYRLQVIEIDQSQRIISNSDYVNIEVIPFEKLPAPSINNELIEIEIEEEDLIENEIKQTNALKNSILKFTKYIGDFIIQSAAAQDIKKINIEWQKVKNAKKYKIEIAEDREFKKIVLEKEVNGTHLTWKPNHQGSYFWHVFAVDEFDQLGDASVVAEIRARFARKKLPAPHLEDFELISNPKGIELLIKWQSIPRAIAYTIHYVVTDKNQSVIFDEIIQVTGNSYQELIELNPGDYKINLDLMCESDEKKKNIKSEIYEKSASVNHEIKFSKNRKKTLNFSLNRLDMGARWADILKNYSGTSVEPYMNMASLQYLIKSSDIGWIFGLSYFRTSSEEILAQGINYQFGINTSISTPVERITFDPQLNLGVGPSLDEGMLLYQLHLPIKWIYTENLHLTFGPGYALGSFYGIKRPDPSINPNINFGGFSFSAGISFWPH